MELSIDDVISDVCVLSIRSGKGDQIFIAILNGEGLIKGIGQYRGFCCVEGQGHPRELVDDRFK